MSNLHNQLVFLIRVTFVRGHASEVDSGTDCTKVCPACGSAKGTHCCMTNSLSQKGYIDSHHKELCDSS